MRFQRKRLAKIQRKNFKKIKLCFKGEKEMMAGEPTRLPNHENLYKY